MAYDMIRVRNRWAVCAAARNARGDAVPLRLGVKFCASGAMAIFACSEQDKAEMARVAVELFPEIPEEMREGLGPVVFVNDNLGHKAVLAVFEKVLAEQGLLA